MMLDRQARLASIARTLRNVKLCTSAEAQALQYICVRILVHEHHQCKVRGCVCVCGGGERGGGGGAYECRQVSGPRE